MKGLLYKEWATLTSSYKQSVFFFAFLYGGISILTGQTGMAYGLLVYIFHSDHLHDFV